MRRRCTTTTTTPQQDSAAEAATDASNAETDVACAWVYASAGCDAAPVCEGPLFDACAMAYCGCNGKSFWGGCGVNDQPFASAGYCDGDLPDQAAFDAGAQ